MSHILLASVPVHGHVTPLLPIARHLVARGDRVVFLTGGRFADVVRATGAEHVRLPDAADFDDRTVTAQFPERDGMPAVKAIAFDFEHIFIRPSEHQYAAVAAMLHDGSFDALVCDPLFFAGAMLAELPASVRVPVVVAGVVPLSYPGPGLAPFGMGLQPASGVFGRIRNAVLEVGAKRMFRPVEAAADEVARRAIGRPLSGSVLGWLPRADAVCQLTVPSFEYPRPDAPPSLVFTGPVRATGAAHPLPEWWPDVETARTVVHVTQGTIANVDLSELLVPTIHALSDTDALVVVATGGAPVASLGPLPPNVRAAEFVPYDELLARTDVFVTNGGYGGVQFALSHGVPIVVAPGKEDKVEVAARVAWSGAGVDLRTQRPTPRALKEAVDAVMSTPSHARAARRIAADIAAASGADGFAAAIDSAIAEHPPRAGLRRGDGAQSSSSSSRGLT